MYTKKIKSRFFLSVLALVFFAVSAFSMQQMEEFKIFQTDKKIRIDGNLEEWNEIKEFPVNLTPDGKEIEPSSDLKVMARFAYDAEKFYAAVEAKDNTFVFPEAGMRFGDGLYLTFLDPYEGNESDRFYTFGFSILRKRPAKLLINKDGSFSPRVSVNDVGLEINADKKKEKIIYEISIPWRYIRPFKPFIHEKWGINIAYFDRDKDKGKIALLYPDKVQVTELSKKNKGAIFRFVNHAPAEAEIQMNMNGSHFYHDEEKTIILAINSPAEKSGWKLRYDMSSGQGLVSKVKEISIRKGMDFLRMNLEEEFTSGSYDISVGVIDEKGSLRFSDTSRFFVVDRDEFEKYKSRIAEVKKGEFFSKDKRYRMSMPTLEIRVDWIEKYMNEAHPFAETWSPFAETWYIIEWYDELKLLFEEVEKGKPALFPAGSIGRYAYKSEIDGTLQPYSVSIPEVFGEKKPLPLFVSLHGRGEDDAMTIMNASSILSFGRFRHKLKTMIVIAPQGRGPSHWYLGESGEDVLECINHIKGLYDIDEKSIILDGFSMGGYGAWRLSLLHPEIFRAVIVRSGAISPPPPMSGENILDFLEKGKRLNFFIVHGEKDRVIPVEGTRRAVQKLDELGINHKYIEVKNEGHGTYNKWKDIINWLKKLIGEEELRRPRTRPKRER